jgi:hypothetical protein
MMTATMMMMMTVISMTSRLGGARAFNFCGLRRYYFVRLFAIIEFTRSKVIVLVEPAS